MPAYSCFQWHPPNLYEVKFLELSSFLMIFHIFVFLMILLLKLSKDYFFASWLWLLFHLPLAQMKFLSSPYPQFYFGTLPISMKRLKSLKITYIFRNLIWNNSVELLLFIDFCLFLSFNVVDVFFYSVLVVLEEFVVLLIFHLQILLISF